MSGRHASSLRAALADHEPARGKRYEPALKARIIEFARSRRDQGASWMQIADEIGLGFETLRRWCIAEEPRSSRAMVPVQVVAEPSDRTVRIVSASGYRIEGLTLQEAVSVLRALG
jgi:transposase-like protein